MLAELVLAVEVLALTAVAFSRPVLETLGDAPDFFEMHRATRSDVIGFGVLVTFLPALVVALPAALGRLKDDPVRQRVHLGLVGVLSAVGVWRFSVEQTGWTSAALVPVLLGVAGGLVVARLRSWSRTAEAAAAFLRYAGVASLIFLGQFLFASETSRADLTGDRPAYPAVAEDIRATLGDDAPPVILLVFDALPTATLLDGEGRIDGDVFPHFGELAEDSTWYRNHTTVAPFTNQALPALLTGRYPRDNGRPDEPTMNLFNMLGASHDLHVHEPTTDLCHRRYCPDAPRYSGHATLLRSAFDLWWSGAAAEKEELWDLSDELGPDRYETALERARTAVQVVAEAEEQPAFVFSHEMLPHQPYQLTDTGRLYEHTDRVADGFFNWGPWGATVGRQAHVLQTQAVDLVLGELLDGLRSEGVYDDALIIVTADHGDAFIPGQSARLVSEVNAHQILWTPLLVKAPGQQRPQVVDDDVRSVDLLPTIAELLGVEPPWPVDGLPAGAAGRAREGEAKRFLLTSMFRQAAGEGWIELDPEEGLAAVLAETPVEGTGPDAVWMRTEHGRLLRRRLDELTIGEARPESVSLEEPDGLDDVDTAAPLPLEVVLETDLEVGSVVALVLNDQVAAVVDVEGGSEAVIHALLVPEAFVDGVNELEVFVVEGAPGDETLRPLDSR